MKKLMKRLPLLLALTVVAVFSLACRKSYTENCRDEARAEGWKSDEVEVAAVYGCEKYKFLEKGEKENTFVVTYYVLTVKDMLEQYERVKKDLEDILSYKNEEEAKFVDTFGLRTRFEHLEEIVWLLYAEVKVAWLDAIFKKHTGQLSSSEKDAGYDVKKMYSVEDPKSTFPFTLDVIESAKQRGVLVPIEHVVWTMDRKFDRKDQDPDSMDDQNAFVWKPKVVTLNITNYKILDTDKPQDNHGNYIEGFRIVNGKPETRPAIKIFMSPYGPAVVVIDSDKEGQDYGFGLPDFVETLAGSITAQDIVQNGAMLDKIFAEKEKEKRIPPKVKPMLIEIARVGQLTEIWEKAPSSDGWLVPFKYWTNRKDNYSVKLKFKKPQDPTKEESPQDFRELEWIAKEWTPGSDSFSSSKANVVEYFRPKDPFGKKVLAIVISSWDKRIHFVFEDGSELDGTITSGKNRFIEDEPFAIGYTEGEKRWILMKDGGSKFERRREVPLSGGDNECCKF